MALTNVLVRLTDLLALLFMSASQDTVPIVLCSVAALEVCVAYVHVCSSS